MTFKTPSHIADTIHQNTDKPSMHIYDLEVMRTKMATLECLPDNVNTFYAMKANPHIAVVGEALKHQNISGIEVASQGEIDTIISAGETDLSKVIYTGPGKKESELEYSIQNSIKYLNVESLVEAVRINMEAERKGVIQPILLRLNTKHKFSDGEAGVILGSGATQFGLDQDDTVSNISILSKLNNIKIDGFHMYPATGIMEADVLLRSVDKSFKDVKQIEKECGIEFPVIDFGGGFGIDYGGEKIFNIQQYADGLQKLIQKHGMNNKIFILETGRYIGADMGYFVTKINDIKNIGRDTKIEGEQGEMITGVICDAGTNAMKRPQVLAVDYHIDIVESVTSSHQEIYNILNEIGANTGKLSPEQLFNVYGPFCTSADWIKKGAKGHSANIGDYVVLPQAGAYGKSMSPQHFLSHPEVPEVIINQ